MHHRVALLVRIDVELSCNRPDHPELLGGNKVAEASCYRIGREVIPSAIVLRRALVLDDVRFFLIKVASDAELYGCPFQCVVLGLLNTYFALCETGTDSFAGYAINGDGDRLSSDRRSVEYLLRYVPSSERLRRVCRPPCATQRNRPSGRFRSDLSTLRAV